jgi:pyruvate/2-oxoglutarate dehydrogenase complex dihydrolipoamide acyltransferase (E2) component
MDVESVDAGYLCKVLAPEGQVVKVGEEIARIADTREERGEQ